MKTSPQSVDNPPTSLKDYVSPPVEPEISSSFDPYTWRNRRPRRNSTAPADGRFSAARWSSSRRCGSATSPGPPARLCRPAACHPRPLRNGSRSPRVRSRCSALLDHVRADPAQGSRTVHPLGHRDARRGPVARRSAGSPSQRIQDNRTELTMIAQHLMQLGDETTDKLGGITASSIRAPTGS